MTWFMLPAAIGLFVKLILLMTAKENLWESKILLGLIAVLAIHNIVELMMFSNLLNEHNSEILLRCYYVCVTTVSAYVVYYSVDSDKLPLSFYVGLIYAVWAVVLSILFLASDSIVNGAMPLTFSVTAIKGDSYWLFQTFALSAIAITWYFLHFNYKASTTPEEEIRNYYALISITPLFLGAGLVMILMLFGVAINAAAVFPISSTLFLLILVHGKHSSSIKADPRDVIPFAQKSELATILGHVSYQYRIGNISHKDLMSKIEKAHIMHKLSFYEFNVSKTAKSMGISRSTLYSKFKILGIECSKFDN